MNGSHMTSSHSHCVQRTELRVAVPRLSRSVVVALARPVDPDTAAAKFVRKKQQLTVRLDFA